MTPQKLGKVNDPILFFQNLILDVLEWSLPIKLFNFSTYRKLSPSLPWEIISVPVVRHAYGTTGLLLMCPMGHQLKLIIYQVGILYEKVENYLLKSQDNFKNLFK
jgi:hypothetical protein